MLYSLQQCYQVPGTSLSLGCIKTRKSIYSRANTTIDRSYSYSLQKSLNLAFCSLFLSNDRAQTTEREPKREIRRFSGALRGQTRQSRARYEEENRSSPSPHPTPSAQSSTFSSPSSLYSSRTAVVLRSRSSRTPNAAVAARRCEVSAVYLPSIQVGFRVCLELGAQRSGAAGCVPYTGRTAVIPCIRTTISSNLYLKQKGRSRSPLAALLSLKAQKILLASIGPAAATFDACCCCASSLCVRCSYSPMPGDSGSGTAVVDILVSLSLVRCTACKDEFRRNPRSQTKPMETRCSKVFL